MAGIGAARVLPDDEEWIESGLGATMVFHEDGSPVLASEGSLGFRISEGIVMEVFDGAGMMWKDCFRAILRWDS